MLTCNPYVRAKPIKFLEENKEKNTLCDLELSKEMTPKV